MPQSNLAEVLVQACQQHNVGVAFGLDDPQVVFAALRRSGIRTVIVHDERSGGFMADGYGRASGGAVALVAGLSGPGATNLTTALLEAFEASSPMLAFVGESEARSAGQRAFQEAPHEVFLSPFVKSVTRVHGGHDADVAVKAAVHGATTGRPRPALLLGNLSQLAEPAAAARPQPQAAVRQSVHVGDDELVREAASLLGGADRPMIIAGNGVHHSGAYAELARLAEHYHVPVATSLFGKGTITDTHPLSVGVASSYTGGRSGVGRVANQYLQRADVVLAVGTDLDSITTSNGAWPAADAALIRVELDMSEAHSGGGLVIGGDARIVLRQLTDAMPDKPEGEMRGAWADAVIADAQNVRAEVRESDLTHHSDGTVWPGAIAQVVSDRLGERDAIVTDASYSSAWALDRVVQDWPGRLVFAPRGSGVLGWGLPAAVGVKIARPNQNVVCFTGDGGLMFSIAELQTVVRESLDLTVVLFNNAQYGFQRHADQLKQGLDYEDLAIGDVNWAQLADSFGWKVLHLDATPDAKAVMDEALEHRGPTFVDARVGADDKPPLSMFDTDSDQIDH